MLDGFGFTGFRSFGDPTAQRVGPMFKVHLVAGPNNSGKSNVLEVAERILPALRDGQDPVLNDVDLPIGDPATVERQLRVWLRAPLDDETLHDWLNNNKRFPVDRVRRVLAGSQPIDPSGVWFEFVNEGRWALSSQQADEIEGAEMPEEPRWLQRLAGALGAGQSDNPARQILKNLSDRLEPRNSIPDVKSIGAFRQIADSIGNEDQDGHAGFGLIERLSQLQNPGHSGEEKRARFERINHFIRSLLDDGEARLEIPHDRKTIQVYHEDKWLPLANYGTGLHEVIILAAAATVLSGCLVCIEEPEVHLHPTLQRKLLKYLNERTDNQYLIATHSAHMLDFGNASISAARLVGGRTELSPVVEPAEVATISFELGARASDLVQANAVIWVEGPADRIYLRRWLRAMNPELLEGIHFSILIYGGRLLSHLSADDLAVEEFIRLPRINRHFAVMIDSDRTGPRKKLDKTKTRVRKEIEATPGAVVWITQGYTIENYVPRDELAAAIKTVHPGAKWKWSGGQYSNPLGSGAFVGKRPRPDKVAIANAVSANPMLEDAWVLNLKRQIRSLEKMIERANA